MHLVTRVGVHYLPKKNGGPFLQVCAPLTLSVGQNPTTKLHRKMKLLHCICFGATCGIGWEANWLKPIDL